MLVKLDFSIIIGNPPYQRRDGGAQASALPVYDSFVEKAKELSTKYLVMIIPARWYVCGKSLDTFRDTMLHDRHICVLYDFPKSSDCFSSVEVKGGICFFLWDKDYLGDCVVNTFTSIVKRPLLDGDIFIRYNEAVSIVKKIMAKNESSFMNIVTSRNTFGFRTYFKTFDSLTPVGGMVKIYANKAQGYIKRNKVKCGIEMIDCWKIYIPVAIGKGDIRGDTIRPILGEPQTICTETYIVIGPFKNKEEAENALSYVKTNFFHFLLCVMKITQQASRKFYRLIPMQDFSKSWTDAELYKKYGLTDEEIDFIC